MSKASVIFRAVVILLCASVPVQAGWWHHRQCCQAPTYYSAPAAAPQAGPNLLLDALIPIFADIIRARIGNLGNQNQSNNTGSPTPEGSSDLTSLKNELALIAAGVENSNTTLKRHGEELTNLRLDMTEVKNEVATIKSLVGATSTLQTDVKNILDKLPKQTKEQLLVALTGNDFFKPVNAQNKLDAAEKSALIDALKKAVAETLTTHYGK